ncbi:MAG: GatB/YqeY domain-containing protein [bacterium]|nr:GatB/YqeY domain-containing protein [bacterium]
MLLDQIQLDLTNAVRSKDQLRVDTLRFLLGAVMNLQIEKYPPSVGGTLTDNDVLSIIAKQIKNHRESIEMFGKGGRQDLVDRETAELEILQSYMPQQLTEEEIKIKILEIKKANPEADFGTLMKLSMAELKGLADGNLVAGFVRENG